MGHYRSEMGFEDEDARHERHLRAMRAAKDKAILAALGEQPGNADLLKKVRLILDMLRVDTKNY
jgi:hypothetical protein